MKSATSAVTVSADARYGYLDLTDDLRRAIKDAAITDGMAVVFCAHTAASLTAQRPNWQE